MKIVNKVSAGMIAALLMAGSASAQNTPTPGGSGSDTGTYLGMPIGSHVLLGGFLFIVVVGGLVLADDDGNPVTPTPTPTPTPATTTTTTTS